MCLILDVNQFGEVFRNPPTAEYKPVLSWLLSNDGRLVYGGRKYSLELQRHEAALRFFRERSRSGQAFRVADGDVDSREEKMRAAASCRSDDEHIIALAQVSGARLLCTADQKLIQDFKNLALVPRPKGRIYRDAGHARLLGHHRGCSMTKPRRNRRRPTRRRRYR